MIYQRIGCFLNFKRINGQFGILQVNIFYLISL